MSPLALSPFRLYAKASSSSYPVYHATLAYNTDFRPPRSYETIEKMTSKLNIAIDFGQSFALV